MKFIMSIVLFYCLLFSSSVSTDSEAINHLLSKSDAIQALLHDLIGFFAQPSPTLDHEERQLRLKVLKNRQDLFQEEVIYCNFRKSILIMNFVFRE